MELRGTSKKTYIPWNMRLQTTSLSKIQYSTTKKQSNVSNMNTYINVK